jgi:predicted AlkP superfamily phosphohydrolase/phosphomutase
VLEWATEFSFWRYQTVPATFRYHIARHIGRNPFTRQPQSGNSQAAHIELRNRLETSISLKTKLSLDLIKRRDLDFIFVVFGEAHKAGHWLWKYYDEAHPDFERAPSLLRNGLPDICAMLDASLGRLLAELEPEDNVIVLSDHGMQAAYRGNHHIEAILESLGLLKRYAVTTSSAPPAPQGLKRRVLRRGAEIVRRMLPTQLAAKTLRPIANIDWQHTRAFALPTDRNSYLRLNVRGREPEGIVEPGSKYNELLDQLAKDFYALINPATGRPAVDKVFRVHEDFPGEHVQDLPDIAILWSAEAPIDQLYSPSIGQIQNQYRELRSGNHREEGFLLARGPAFSGETARLQGNIYQIAPTLLNLYGIDCSRTDMELPLREILAPNR